MSSLSAGQLAVLKNAILAETDPTFVALRAAGASGAMAEWYNGEASPQLALWRPRIAVSELINGVVWSDFITAGIANQNAWFALTQGGYIDATVASIRAGFVAVFGAGSQSVTNLAALAQVSATRFEALFTTSNVSSVFGLRISHADIDEALRS